MSIHLSSYPCAPYKADFITACMLSLIWHICMYVCAFVWNQRLTDGTTTYACKTNCKMFEFYLFFFISISFWRHLWSVLTSSCWHTKATCYETEECSIAPVLPILICSTLNRLHTLSHYRKVAPSLRMQESAVLELLFLLLIRRDAIKCKSM